MSGYRGMIHDFFKGKGLSEAAIAGIMGNLMTESSFDPSAHNPNEGAIGFAQWEGGRRTALQQWALNHHGAMETDARSQLEFMWHELTTQYTGALNALRNARTPAEAAAAFDSQYEVSAGTTRQQRIDYAHQFYTGTGPNPSAVPGGDSSTFASAGGSGGATVEKMTKDDYRSVDSLGSLLDSVPELRHLVDQAISHNWSADKFQNSVEDSKWWKHHSSSARAVIIQQANDPRSYQQSLTNAKNTISGLAHQLGFDLTGSQLQSIAYTALLTGNDNNQQWITQQVGRRQDYGHLRDTGDLTGGMAATVQQLQEMAGQYGYRWSPAQLAQRAQNILTGNTTIDTYRQRLTDWAKSAFPGLADQIEHGATVKDLADPYVTSMSQLLEVDPATLNTYTPAIRRAMQGAVDPSTKQRTSTPLWQFEDQIRQDPRWQYTQNAKDTMSTALVKLGHDWGFGGF